MNTLLIILTTIFLICSQAYLFLMQRCLRQDVDSLDYLRRCQGEVTVKFRDRVDAAIKRLERKNGPWK